MKNILYNKITKWVIAAVCFLLIGSMLFTSYEMLERHYEYIKEDKRLCDTYSEEIREGEKTLDKQLNSAFVYILNIYAKYGVEGVKDFYEGSMDEQIDVLEVDVKELLDKSNIIIADANQIYSNFVNLENTEIEDNSVYVEQYHTNRRKDKIKYKYNVEIKQYADHLNERYISAGVVYDYWNDMVMDGDERLHQILQPIDYSRLVIRLFCTHEYAVSYNEKIEQEMNAARDELKNNYVKDEKNMVVELITQAVCLVVALVVLAILYGKSVEGVTTLNKWEAKAVELHILVLAVLGTPVTVLTMYLYKHMYYYTFVSNWMKRLMDQGVRWAYIILGTVVVSAIFYEIGILIKKRKNKRILKDCAILQFIIKVVKGIGRFLKKVYDRTGYEALPDIKKKYIRKIILDIVVAIVAVVAVIIVNVVWENVCGEFIYSYQYDWFWKNAFGIQWPLYVAIYIPIIIYYINSFKEYFDLRKYNKVAKAIETIYNGNYNSFTVEDSEKNDALKMLAHLSDNFEESVRKQVEAEKMQIELVANVSHDLKTPLTSIISYVELLKEEEMSEVAKDYVKVLSDKSDRLKYIVADVFDLAKATSGEQVPMEELDGVVLINQVLSDMQDKIETSGRDLRSKVVPETAPLTGNGQKLYRVFQNIIDNALKYSMPGTRIYLTADMEGAEFVVTLKNVSEYEMDFTAEEIMSRFTRGDKARHSEGNGLGLSIAKSFTELMGGSFTVEIDDDLFKTVVRLR